MSDLIKLTPIFHEKIWGGRQLETVFGYDIPDGPIGECWAISAHPNGDCQIAEGPYAGHTLSWLWAEHRELFGNCEGKEFPLLIKILDAKDDLSIQIHPNDEYAAEHENGSLGKTECWYVLDCEPDAGRVASTFGSGAPRAKKPSSKVSPTVERKVDRASASQDFAAGDTVSHKTFGTGTVISVAGDMIEVQFEKTGQTKKLMKGFAPIVKLS